MDERTLTEDNRDDAAQLRRSLEAAMRQFGRQRANLVAARKLFNKRLMQGSVTLILTSVLMGLDIWPIVPLALGLLGAAWVVLAVGISDICDTFHAAALQAQQRLLGLLERPEAGPLYEELYEQMEDFEYRHWLREYLPGRESLINER